MWDDFYSLVWVNFFSQQQDFRKFFVSLLNSKIINHKYKCDKDIKFGDGDGPNLYRVKKADVSSTFY